MKKFLAALLIVGSLFFVSTTVEAAIEIYIGEGSATMSKAETQDAVIDRAKVKALRNAQKQAGVYIRSQASGRNLKLVEADIETLTGKIVKISKTDIRKSLSDDGVIQVRVTVTVQIDTDALQSELDKFLGKPVETPKPVEKPKPHVDKPKPTPPIERPKPIETPAPSNKIQIYEGNGEYRMGQRDTLEIAQQGAKNNAIRNALERAGVLIQSRSRTQDSELIEDVITSQTGAVLKVLEVKYDHENFLVKAHVRIEVDVDDLNRRLAEYARKHKR